MSHDYSTILDDFDIQILSVLHEFEYDPLKSERGRITPVPAYVLYAATIPLVAAPGERHEATFGPNVVARAEALCKLGLIKRTDQRLLSFGMRELRNGRFIDIDCERGVDKRFGGRRGEEPIPFQVPFIEYHVRFGLQAEFYDDYDKACDGLSSDEQFDIWETVAERYDQLRCRFYDKKKEIEYWDSICVGMRGSQNELGYCYSLEPGGISTVRQIIGRQEAPDEKTNSPDGEAPPKSMRGHPAPSVEKLKSDKRIAEAWATKQYTTYAELDSELGLPEGHSAAAIDRHRHRKTSRKK